MKKLNYFEVHKNKTKRKKLPVFICPKKMQEAYLYFLEAIENYKKHPLK